MPQKTGMLRMQLVAAAIHAIAGATEQGSGVAFLSPVHDADMYHAVKKMKVTATTALAEYGDTLKKEKDGDALDRIPSFLKTLGADLYDAAKTRRAIIPTALANFKQEETGTCTKKSVTISGKVNKKNKKHV